MPTEALKIQQHWWRVATTHLLMAITSVLPACSGDSVVATGESSAVKETVFLPKDLPRHFQTYYKVPAESFQDTIMEAPLFYDSWSINKQSPLQYGLEVQDNDKAIYNYYRYENIPECGVTATAAEKDAAWNRLTLQEKDRHLKESWENPDKNRRGWQSFVRMEHTPTTWSDRLQLEINREQYEFITSPVITLNDFFAVRDDILNKFSNPFIDYHVTWIHHQSTFDELAASRIVTLLSQLNEWAFPLLASHYYLTDAFRAMRYQAMPKEIWAELLSILETAQSAPTWWEALEQRDREATNNETNTPEQRIENGTFILTGKNGYAKYYGVGFRAGIYTLPTGEIEQNRVGFEFRAPGHRPLAAQWIITNTAYILTALNDRDLKIKLGDGGTGSYTLLPSADKNVPDAFTAATSQERIFLIPDENSPGLRRNLYEKLKIFGQKVARCNEKEAVSFHSFRLPTLNFHERSFLQESEKNTLSERREAYEKELKKLLEDFPDSALCPETEKTYGTLRSKYKTWAETTTLPSLS